MTTQEKIDAKRKEYADLSGKIDRLPQGPVRLELKRKRNFVTADLVRLRHERIAEELASDNPQHVPRETFGRPEICPPAEPETAPYFFPEGDPA